MKRTRKKHNAGIKAKGWWWRRSGDRTIAELEMSLAFIRTRSTTGRSRLLDGTASVLEGGGGARACWERGSLEKRCPSDGGPMVRIRLPPLKQTVLSIVSNILRLDCACRPTSPPPAVL